MKIVKMFGGHAVAVCDESNPKKKAFAKTLQHQGRVNFTVPANYTKDSKTYKVVCAIIDKIKADYELKRLSKSAF